MITPDYLNEVVKSVQMQMAEIDAYLIERIAIRIDALFRKTGEVKLIPSTINDIHKLMDKKMMAKDVEKVLEKLMPDLEKELKKAFRDASVAIAKDADDATNTLIEVIGANGEIIKPMFDKKAVEGVPLNKMGLTTAEIRKIESAYRRTHGTIKNLTKTTATQANQMYVDQCDKAFWKIKSGVSANTAIVEAIKEMSESGITVVDYPSGRTEKAEVAVARAVRTGVNQASSDVVLMRCAELGIGYVYVSQHLGARVTNTHDYKDHSHWQGKVYSLDYSNPVLAPYRHEADKSIEEYPYMQEMRKKGKISANDSGDFIKECGYGDLLGICGVNCRHTFSIYVPNGRIPERIDEKESAKKYKAEQTARAMERKQRNLRKLIKGLKGIDTDEAKQALKDARTKLTALDDEYMTFCKANKITPINWRRQPI